MELKKNKKEELYASIKEKIIKYEEYKIEYIDSAVNRYMKEILFITSECFNESSFLFLKEALPKALSEENMKTIVIKHKGLLVGYASYQLKRNHIRLKDTIYYNEEITYVAMCAILPKYQNKGLYKLLTYLRLINAIECKNSKIFVRTQNIKVLSGINKTLENFKEYGLIKSYGLKFNKIEKKTFNSEISSKPNFIKEIPKEMEGLEVENGDIGLFLWNIEK